MDLLTPGILVVAVLLAGGAIAAGVWLIPRVGRHQQMATLGARAGVIGVRVLVMGVTSGLVAVSAGLALNYQNDWYSSWSEVFGLGQPGPGTVTRKGSVADAAGDTAPSTVTWATYPALPAPGQRIQVFTVTSPDGLTSNQVIVLLPEDYFETSKVHHLYPVIYAGHGMPGHPAQWLHNMDIRTALDPMTTQKKIAASIVVIPSLETSTGEDTECTFGPHGPRQIENWLATTVPDFIIKHMRANPARTAWATMGISAGGWCAAMLTLLHPDRFVTALVLSGYFRPWWGTPPPWPLTSATERRYDLVRLAATSPPPVAIWVETSRNDPESGVRSAQFLAAARPPLSVTSLVLAAAGHRTSLWHPLLPKALTWLAANIPAFNPRLSPG